MTPIGKITPIAAKAIPHITMKSGILNKISNTVKHPTIQPDPDSCSDMIPPKIKYMLSGTKLSQITLNYPKLYSSTGSRDSSSIRFSSACSCLISSFSCLIGEVLPKIDSASSCVGRSSE